MDRGPNASIGAQRFMVWLSIILCAVFGGAVMGLMRFLPAIPANLSADQVVQLYAEHNIRFRIGVRDDARHPGGANIFGRGFGNYDQDIVMRITCTR